MKSETWVEQVALSMDGTLGISTSYGGLEVWDLKNLRRSHTLRDDSARLNAVALSADGKIAASAADDKSVKIWDVASGQETARLQGHSGTVFGVALTTDGRIVISASYDRTLKVWDVESRACLATFSCEGEPLCCCIVGGLIITGDTAGRVYFLKLEQ